MEFIKLEVADYIAVVTMCRPPANAFNYQMYKDMKEAFDQIESREDIRVAVIRAEGSFFSAGNDVNDFQQGVSEEYGNTVEIGLAAIVNCTKPVISAVQGTAVGSGFCVASYSDIVIASPKAKFGITEIRVGIIGGAPEASYSLPSKIVRYMALTGNLLTAEQAKDYGMVLKIVEEDKLMDEAMKIAGNILATPPVSMGFMKASLNNIYRPDILAEKIAFDGGKTQESIETEDFMEAVRAFLEKRKPEYKGK